MIKDHEGLRLKPYKDTVGKLTIGYGRNLEDNGITKDEALHMLFADIRRVKCEASARLRWFNELDSVRRDVVIDMVFNLGIGKFLKFKKMIKAMSYGDFTTASKEMLDSDWAGQVGTRAKTLSKMMEFGTY